MRFNRKQFFDGLRKRIDETISQEQVDGLEFLLGEFETDPHWVDLRHIAYALATVFHETAGSFQPVEEGYYLGSKERVEKFQKTLRYFPYFGRGYVQLTWRTNYEKAGRAIDVDLVGNPELALKADIAFRVLTLGLFRGWYGGKLTTYINETKCDYVNARRCVNGRDKAGLIAGYAKSFEKILRASKLSAEPSSRPDESLILTSDSTTPGGQADTQQSPSGEVLPVNVTEITTARETKNEQSVAEVVVQSSPVAYNDGKGLKDTLISDAKAVLPANAGVQTISEYAQQASGWPEWVIGMLGKVALGLLIATALWVIYRLVSWVMHNWRENEKQKLLAMINTDKNRKDLDIQ